MTRLSKHILMEICAFLVIWDKLCFAMKLAICQHGQKLSFGVDIILHKINDKLLNCCPPTYQCCEKCYLIVCAAWCSFSHGHRQKAGRELQTALNTRDNE